MFGQAPLSTFAIAEQAIIAFSTVEMIGTFTKVNVGSGTLAGVSEQIGIFTQTSTGSFI